MYIYVCRCNLRPKNIYLSETKYLKSQQNIEGNSSLRMWKCENFLSSLALLARIFTWIFLMLMFCSNLMWRLNTPNDLGDAAPIVFFSSSSNRAANFGWGFGVRYARPVRSQPINVAQVPKRLMSGGGDSVTFFFWPQQFWHPFSHSRHIVGVPSYISNLWQAKKKTWDISIYAWEREIQVKWGEMRESHAQCVRVGSPASKLACSARLHMHGFS